MDWCHIAGYLWRGQVFAGRTGKRRARRRPGVGSGHAATGSRISPVSGATVRPSSRLLYVRTHTPVSGSGWRGRRSATHTRRLSARRAWEGAGFLLAVPRRAPVFSPYVGIYPEGTCRFRSLMGRPRCRRCERVSATGSRMRRWSRRLIATLTNAVDSAPRPLLPFHRLAAAVLAGFPRNVASSNGRLVRSSLPKCDPVRSGPP